MFKRSEREAALQDELVKFLEEQDELNNPRYEIHQPVILLREHAIRFCEGCRIDSNVKIEGGEGVHIGRYVHIAFGAHINVGGGNVFLDDFSAVASGARIVAGSNETDALTMSASAPIGMQRITRSAVHVGKYACILVGAIVLPGVTLGDGAVLGAGAVATKSIPEWEIWVGNPARFLKKREVLHGDFR